ncbi:hypothetical protein [Acrocarpospora macrocephala]|uniref:hypothetical protein n=1 Tax=Acrocarpospora macrocephala TaxID=150177 RepID=UPI0012D360A3
MQELAREFAVLDLGTFEIEEIADLGSAFASVAEVPADGGCSTSSCCSCSTSSCCSCSCSDTSCSSSSCSASSCY